MRSESTWESSLNNVSRYGRDFWIDARVDTRNARTSFTVGGAARSLRPAVGAVVVASAADAGGAVAIAVSTAAQAAIDSLVRRNRRGIALRCAVMGSR